MFFWIDLLIVTILLLIFWVVSKEETGFGAMFIPHAFVIFLAGVVPLVLAVANSLIGLIIGSFHFLYLSPLLIPIFCFSLFKAKERYRIYQYHKKVIPAKKHVEKYLKEKGILKIQSITAKYESGKVTGLVVDINKEDQMLLNLRKKLFTKELQELTKFKIYLLIKD